MRRHKAEYTWRTHSCVPRRHSCRRRSQTIRLADLRGKIVVLAFWATWCPPCLAEMPGLTRLQKKLEPEGVAVIPIANDDPAKARDFLAQKKLDPLSLFDGNRTVSRLYGANVLPRTFILDRNGIVVNTHLGKMSEADVRHNVDLIQRAAMLKK
jgi:peroxiredoxin